MTCIVGFTNKENGVTYLGGDSCVSWGSSIKATLKQKKVFKLKDTNNAILGFSGSVRDCNLLQYATNLIDKRDEPNIDEEYIVTKFIPQIIKTIEDGGRCSTSNGQKDMDSYFLLGYKDKLWQIGFDYSVVSITDDYQSVGSGCYYAMASMATTEDTDMKPIDRIHRALQVASKFVSSVAPPFFIINTKDDTVLEFKD